MKIPVFVTSLLLAILCLPSNVNAQKLHGCIREQNSGNKPVAGVTVRAVHANPALSDKDGYFILIFPDLKPGMPVQITAQKPGWITTDQKELELNLPLESVSQLQVITMSLEAKQKKLVQDNSKAIVKLMEKSFEDLKLQNKQLAEQIAQQKMKVPELAVEISSVNQDKISDSERISTESFRQGNFEKAVQIRADMQSEKNFDMAQNAAQAGDTRTLEIHRRNLVAQSRLAMIEFNFEKADSTLAFLAQHDSLEFESVYRYANFLQQQMQYDKAIEFYTKALEMAHTDFDRIKAWNNLGYMYRQTGKYEPAQKLLTLALEKSKALADSNLATSEAYLAMTQTNLGLLYRSKNNYTAAINAFKTALTIQKKQVKENAAFFEPLLAANLLNLGAIYNDANNYPAAESAYNQALQLYQQMASDSLNIYDRQIADVQNNLGLTHTEERNFGMAEKSFKAALVISRRLAGNAPAAYKSDMAETLLNLGNLYRKMPDYGLADQALQEALQLRQEMANSNLATNATAGLAEAQLYIGLLRMEQKDKAEAKLFLEKALETAMKTVPNNPVANYGAQLSTIQYNLGELYRQNKEDTAAERMYQQALDIRRQLVDSPPGFNDLQVATTLWSLGQLYNGQKNYSSAQSNLQDALTIYKSLAKDSLAPYYADASYNAFITANMLGFVFFKQERYDIAARTQQDAIDIGQRLARERPGLYDGDIADLQTSLGHSYLKKKDFASAEAAYIEAASIFRKLKNNRPETNEVGFCWAVVYCGELYKEYKTPAKYPAYQQWLGEALSILPRLQNKQLQQRLQNLQRSVQAEAPPN